MKIENGRYEVLIRGKFTILASQTKQYSFCRPLLKLGLPCSSFMTFILNRFLCFYHCQKIAFLALLSICPSSWWPPTRRQLVACRERDTRIIIASLLFLRFESILIHASLSWTWTWTCTILERKCSPINQSQLSFSEKKSSDWLRSITTLSWIDCNVVILRLENNSAKMLISQITLTALLSL